MKKCIGCGASLQDQDPKAIGYVKSLKQDYCMRCFRLAHYGDLMIDMKDAIPPEFVLNKIKKYNDAGVVLIIDILHLASKVNKKIFASLTDYPIMVVINKIDLLPANINFQKVEKYCKDILSMIAKNNKIASVILTYDKDTGFNDLFLEDIKDMGMGTYIFTGLANAGKSTLLNKIVKDNKLTTSYYPGTTIDFNTFEYENYNFVDTPGLVDEGSILQHLQFKDITSLVPSKTIRPLVYQVYEDQTFFIEGIMRLDVKTRKNSSVIFYFDPKVKLHRVKTSRADDYMKNNYELFESGYKLNSSTIKLHDYQDLVINGLGFISFHHIDSIKIDMIEGVEICVRKGIF